MRDKVLRDNAFRDVQRFEPDRVKVTRRKKGEKAARKQAIAIALDEARRMGVKV